MSVPGRAHRRSTLRLRAPAIRPERQRTWHPCPSSWASAASRSAPEQPPRRWSWPAARAARERHRRPQRPQHRHDRHDHVARPGRLVRQRLVRRAEPGLPVPDEHARTAARTSSPTSPTTARVHRPDDLQVTLKDGPRVRERQRAHLERRQVHVRPPADDRQRQRPVVAAREPQEHRRARRHDRRLHAEGRRPDLAAGALEPRRPDRRRGRLLGATSSPAPTTSSRATPSPGSTRSPTTRRTSRSSTRRTTTTTACSARRRPTTVTATYYTEETDLKLAVQKGDVDVAYRSPEPDRLSPTSRRTTRSQVHRRPRRRDPLHGLQLQHAALRRGAVRRRRGEGPGRAPGRRRRRRPRGPREGGLQRHLHARSTRSSPTA